MENNKVLIPGPQLGLNEIMNAYTQQNIEERNNSNEKWNPLRPSAAGKCERELAYEFMQFRGLAKYPMESNTAEVSRLLNLGSSIEYHANNEMKWAFAKSPKPIKMKYKQQSVTICRLHDGTLIEGSIDLWIETDEWRCMADWKSKSDKYSQFYKSSWDEFADKLVNTGHAVLFGEDAVFITDLALFLKTNPDSFFNNNLYQLNMYAATEFAKERRIDFCSIMQYNKNDSRIREVRFVPNQEVSQDTIAKFQRVAQAVDTDKAVDNTEKQYVLGSQKCGFCSFRTTCWPENDALKAYFQTFPPKQWAKDLNRLPPAVQAELVPLFETYHEMSSVPSKLEAIEESIVKVLDRAKVYKVRLNEDQIYRVKRLKTGGPKNGERYVLRRDKA